MTDRRYDEAEVAEIFRRAAEAQQDGKHAPLASRQGMTLDALQEIGRDVGLPPELIARAASAIDRGGHAHTRRFLGLPLGVGRTVDLDRRLTDAEWERTVVDLRETFDAKGRLRQDGSFRQWSNGNLQVLLEPLERGERLRLRTTNGAARFWMMGGLATLAVAAVTAIGLFGDPGTDVWARSASLAALGAGLFTLGAVRLPTWARTRRRQMEEIATRVSASIQGIRDGERST